MEIEKLKSSGTVSYQGSAAGVSTKSVAETGSSTMSQDSKAESQSVESFNASEENKQTAQSSQLKSAVNEINRQMKNSEAIFGIHEKTNRVTIKIVDKSTKEVLKEYPPEETLDMIAKVWEIAGILVDEKR
ncbi:MAG: flagellar protein FlaG [Roseburia sp.]